MTEPKQPEQQPGYWPSSLRQFLWDLSPSQSVPAQGGLRAPDFVEPPWLNLPFADTKEAVEQARLAHEKEASRAAEAEAKGSRLAQTSLALLALALTLAGFEASGLRQVGGGALYLWLVPVALAIGSLALGGIEALEIDRVGLYWPVTPEDVAGAVEELSRRQVLAEERGRQLAAWSATKKFDALLQARAWFTRGLVVLALAGLIGVVVAAVKPPAPSTSPSPTTPSPSVSQSPAYGT
jgi:hypothetical protein